MPAHRQIKSPPRGALLASEGDRGFSGLWNQRLVFFSVIARFGLGAEPRASAFAVSRRLFAHGLGTIYFCAFASLGVQLMGLAGSRGISPAAEFLRVARAQLGSGAALQAPSVFWLGAGDSVLAGWCIAGAILSVLLALGICPGFLSLLCWGIYLSFCSVTSPFLDFQWDTLLLETGLIAAVYLPWQPLPRWSAIAPVSHIGRCLIWWLLFRLMFESGIVKLSWHDPAWRDLSAMRYHYETQPLPLVTAWWAAQAPLWVLKAQSLFVFVAELAMPFLILAPRRLRHFGALVMMALQAGILVTGNFAFFNYLSILLCVPLLDDRFWPGKLRAWLIQFKPPPPRGSPLAAVLLAPGAAAILLLASIGFCDSCAGPSGSHWPNWARSLERYAAPFRSFNSYGLFRVLTTERPEIVVEGSDDGEIWLSYEFRWKPGNVAAPPRLVAPHQPRLDWQMWFAALGNYRENDWFIRFLGRLLEGSPPVLRLLKTNPFPAHPPRYVRAILYRYRFTHFGDGRDWWTRNLVGLYCPPLTLGELDSSPPRN